MIVEDEDMIRKGLVFTIDWLSMDCVVVAEASNGQEGYERILEYKPDVVIADICMPFMDGIEMIQKASEKVKFKSILLTLPAMQSLTMPEGLLRQESASIC